MTEALFHRHWGYKSPASPNIVAIHGLFGSMENLGMITRLLKEDFSVYGLDLPNHGRSPHTTDCSLSSMADAVIRWMDSVDLDNAYFFGHSLGGKVCMEAALRYPDRVNALIVADIAPVAYPGRHDDVFKGFGAIDLSTLNSRGDADKAMQRFVPEPSVRSFLLKNLDKTTEGWSWRINLKALVDNYQEFLQANTSRFPAFTKPALFIKGERSDYILPKYKEATLTLFPNADVKIINDTGHWLHAEKPEVFTRIIKRFLATVRAC